VVATRRRTTVDDEGRLCVWWWFERTRGIPPFAPFARNLIGPYQF